MLQLQQTVCCLKLIHLAIDARGYHRRLINEAKVFRIIDTLLHFCVLANDRTTFDSIKDFSCMETQNGEIAFAQYAHPILFYPKGVSCIINNLQPVSVGNFLNSRCITRNTVTMYE